MKKSIKENLYKTVRELCKKFPTSSTRSIASMAQKQNPIHSFEEVRLAVRYVRGEKLTMANKKVSNSIPREAIPEPVVRNYGPMVLGKCNIGILSDAHIPHHDKTAIECAVAWLKKRSPDTIILNGDMLDCYQVSFFDKDPTIESMNFERAQGMQFMAYVRSQFPKARIIYREGNHEERLQRYLMSRAPAIFGIPDFDMPGLLKLANYGIEWLSDKRIINAGKIAILHGHELSRGIAAPVNPARGLFLKGKDSAIMGHSHQTSEHTEKTINDKLIGTWSVGCLAQLKPRYNPINNYNHGVAGIRVESNGDFHVENKRIRDGGIL